VTEVEGLRQRRHLRKTWWDGVKEDIKSFGVSQEDEQVLNNGKGSRICITVYCKLLIHHTVLSATHMFIHKWNEPYLPLLPATEHHTHFPFPIESEAELAWVAW